MLNDEPRRQTMGEAGFARVNERFTVERMVAQTAAVYERLVAARTAERPRDRQAVRTVLVPRPVLH